MKGVYVSKLIELGQPGKMEVNRMKASPWPSIASWYIVSGLNIVSAQKKNGSHTPFVCSMQVQMVGAPLLYRYQAIPCICRPPINTEVLAFLLAKRGGGDSLTALSDTCPVTIGDSV